ncbi:MAG: FAD/NAD(P)-binding protein [Magnetovibrionaceae bacterium]
MDGAPTLADFQEDPLLPRVYRVIRRRRDLADTFTIDIAPVDGGPIPAFDHGQFNMLGGFGAGEVPISIAGDVAERGFFRHTIRSVGAGTGALEALRKGDHLSLRGPYGRPWPLSDLKGLDVVVVSGGLGLAPLRSSILGLIAARKSYGRVILLHGARSPADLIYERELHEWRGRFDLSVEVTVDRAGSDWSGQVGVVPKLIRRADFDGPQAAALICGPEIMMRYSAEALIEDGVSPEAIWVSLERHMRCAVGFCGRCQLGAQFVCRDGPVFRWDDIEPLLKIREL